jgi:hypothetical protein
MVPESNDPYDRLFDEYRSRKQAEKAEASEKASRELAARSRAVDAIRVTVLPVLEQLAKRLRREGHTATMKERLENHIQPNVDLEFTPVDPTEIRQAILPSRLIFISTDCVNLSIRREIQKPSGGKHNDAFELLDRSSSRLDAVTQDWVLAQTIRFVSDVLKLY